MTDESLEHDGLSVGFSWLLESCPTIRCFVVCSGAIAERAIERASRSTAKAERSRFRHNKYVAWERQYEALRTDAPHLTTAQIKDRVLSMQWGACVWTESIDEATAVADKFTVEMIAVNLRKAIAVEALRLSEEVAWIVLWRD